MFQGDLGMTDSFRDHPSCEALERYSLNALPEAEVAGVEEHLLVCETCRQIVSEMDVFAPLLRGGPKSHPVAFVHTTDDGPVTLELEALPGSKWSARFWGKQLEGLALMPTAAEAYRHLRTSFAEMYPGHLCSGGCGPSGVVQPRQRRWPLDQRQASANS
jgi:hypothetical protein